MSRRIDTDVYESSFAVMFKGLVLIALAVAGMYFLYFNAFLGYKFGKACDEITILNRNVQNFYKGLYRGLNTDSAYTNQLIAPSMAATRNENGVTLQNSFGGNIIIMEALNTGNERSLFYGLQTEPEKYKRLYQGVTSYIVMYTGLNKNMCMKFARNDWKLQIPTFIGIEVSNIPANKIYQGFSKLRAGFIDDDKENDKYYTGTKDKGIISQYPLEKKEAEDACSCTENNCTIALKIR